MKNSLIKIVFGLLVIDFILIISGMFVPGLSEWIFNAAGYSFFWFEQILFMCLGIALIVLTVKNKIAGHLRVYLLLTGISATGLFVFAILHNLLSGALSVIFNSEIEEPVFFLLAVFACPIGFLLGAIRSIFLFFNERDGKEIN